jgi:hypothetical protein
VILAIAEDMDSLNVPGFFPFLLVTTREGSSRLGVLWGLPLPFLEFLQGRVLLGLEFYWVYFPFL